MTTSKNIKNMDSGKLATQKNSAKTGEMVVVAVAYADFD